MIRIPFRFLVTPQGTEPVTGIARTMIVTISPRALVTARDATDRLDLTIRTCEAVGWKALASTIRQLRGVLILVSDGPVDDDKNPLPIHIDV